MDEILKAHAEAAQQYANAHSVPQHSVVVDTIEGAFIGAVIGNLIGSLITMFRSIFGRH